MKKHLTSLIICTLISSTSLWAKIDTYQTSGGEIIFSWGDLKYTEAFMNKYPNAEIISTPVRFTVFLHLQEFWHIDLNNNIGFMTGVGLRNIGQISNEILPENYTSDNSSVNYFEAKVIRRTYSVGVPLAFKVGSFKDDMYVYAGGEIEWAFHMKEKWWESSNRSGTKTKHSAWWPQQITAFQPSAFVGIQVPGGVNIKFKYYINNFLNQSYDNYANTASTKSQVVSDLTKYEESQLFYFSICFNLKPSELPLTNKKKSIAFDINNLETDRNL